MYRPKYTITDYCLSLIEKITGFASKLNQAKVAMPAMARLQREAVCRNVHSSTSIEGNVLSLAQVSALSEKREIDADILQKREVANSIEALRWVIKHSHHAITEKRLLDLHAKIVAGLVPEKKAGHYKTKQNYVINEKKIVVYTAPSPKDSPRLFKDLIKWVNASKEVHPIIVSAVFHHQSVSIHPFSDGNGRLSRSAAQWILYSRGFDPQHILSLDDFYASDRKRYYAKIQQARELDDDLTHWIEYVGEGVLDTMEKIYARISRLSYADKKVVITPKQEQLVELLNTQGSLSSAEIGKLLTVNRARVNQLITPLLKAGIIVKEGRARATRYYLKVG